MAKKSMQMPSGFTMVYREAGDSNAPTLLILHGLGANHVQFESDVEYFALTRHVLQPDMRGHGDSGAPADAVGADFTCRKFAEDLSYFLDQLGVKQVDIIGNSLGGDIAWELIDLRPGLARSLTTFGTTYKLYVPRFLLVIKDLIYWYLGDKLAEWAANKVGKTPQGREVLKRTFSGMQPRTAKLVGPNICKFDYLPILEKYPGHVLLLQCKGDDDINATLKPTLAALAKHPRAEVRQFTTGGHCCNVDDPDGFRAEVDRFLAKVESATPA